jgi:Zn finger protein HypA/HybF involved in hydrogenase expression
VNTGLLYLCPECGWWQPVPLLVEALQALVEVLQQPPHTKIVEAHVCEQCQAPMLKITQEERLFVKEADETRGHD